MQPVYAAGQLNCACGCVCCSPGQLGWVLAQAAGVKAVVSGQRAVQVGWEGSAREPAGAVALGSLCTSQQMMGKVSEL
jgi:hypothetical protein